MQGPALCVQNNSVFSERDIESIQKLGVGSKSTDPDKTGQFGKCTMWSEGGLAKTLLTFTLWIYDNPCSHQSQEHTTFRMSSQMCSWDSNTVDGYQALVKNTQ